MTSVAKDGTVEFWFYRRGVREVRVVGDFADWRGGTFEMAGDGDGWWRLSTTLCAGEYRFRYSPRAVVYGYASKGIEWANRAVNRLGFPQQPPRAAHWAARMWPER